VQPGVSHSTVSARSAACRRAAPPWRQASMPSAASSVSSMTAALFADRTGFQQGRAGRRQASSISARVHPGQPSSRGRGENSTSRSFLQRRQRGPQGVVLLTPNSAARLALGEAARRRPSSLLSIRLRKVSRTSSGNELMRDHGLLRGSRTSPYNANRAISPVGRIAYRPRPRLTGGSRAASSAVPSLRPWVIARPSTRRRAGAPAPGPVRMAVMPRPR